MPSDFRDPRNDHRIDVLVERVIMRAEGVTDSIKALHEALDHVIELTPVQADRMGRAVGHIAVAMGHVMISDLELTHEREDLAVELDDSEPVH